MGRGFIPQARVTGITQQMAVVPYDGKTKLCTVSFQFLDSQFNSEKIAQNLEAF